MRNWVVSSPSTCGPYSASIFSASIGPHHCATGGCCRQRRSMGKSARVTRRKVNTWPAPTLLQVQLRAGPSTSNGLRLPGMVNKAAVERDRRQRPGAVDAVGPVRALEDVGLTARLVDPFHVAL